MRSRRGANAVELALVAPLLLALLTGIVDYGWTTMLRQAATAAATAGARAGAVTARKADPDGVAAATAASTWDGLNLPATPRIVTFRSGSPERITVRVTVDVAPLVGLVPGPSRLGATSVERMQEQP